MRRFSSCSQQRRKSAASFVSSGRGGVARPPHAWRRDLFVDVAFEVGLVGRGFCAVGLAWRRVLLFAAGFLLVGAFFLRRVLLLQELGRLERLRADEAIREQVVQLPMLLLPRANGGPFHAAFAAGAFAAGELVELGDPAPVARVVVVRLLRARLRLLVDGAVAGRRGRGRGIGRCRRRRLGLERLLGALELLFHNLIIADRPEKLRVERHNLVARAAVSDRFDEVRFPVPVAQARRHVTRSLAVANSIERNALGAMEVGGARRTIRQGQSRRRSRRRVAARSRVEH